MPRKPRIDIKGFYHVINRGVEKRTIFMDESDFNVFLRIVNKGISVYNFKLHAYALMKNHYHLLLETSGNNLSLIMRQINSKYSIYFNKKYNRVGPLWQGRFKSFYIHDIAYLKIVIKYIENNPVKAGIVDKPSDYPYVSKNIESLTTKLWSQDDDLEWEKWKNCKFDITGRNNAFAPGKRKKPLSEYFPEGVVSDGRIVTAVIDGYKQAAIAEYLEVSTALVSRRVKRYDKRNELFSVIKQKGYFWSYDRGLEYSEELDDIFMETVLKYGDFEDLEQLFILYGKRRLRKIWKEKLANDTRFTKLNYFLARIFFKMKVEAEFFKGGISDRERKLRMLAS